jgi:hypothetical protein
MAGIASKASQPISETDMASERQIQANRRNALNSTGPRSERGKERSSRNALRHGLTAETVVTSLENPEAYRALEDALLAEWDPQTITGRQLVLRLASLLWRLRRASLIEAGVFEIQTRNLVEQRQDESSHGRLAPFYRILREPMNPASSLARIPDKSATANTSPINGATETDAGALFLRLHNLNGEALERLGRYEMRLARQFAQTLLILNTLAKV